MVLLVPIFAGILVALLRGGSLWRLADLRVRLGWLAIICFVTQMCVAYYPLERLESDRGFQALLLTGSHVALVIVVWANRRLYGMSVVGIGLVLNLMVIVANGGFMPISGEAIVAASIRTAESVPAGGSRLPRSKDIVLPLGETRLQLLSDRLVAPGVQASKVYSVGDVVVGLGAFLLVQMAMMTPRRTIFRSKGGLGARCLSLPDPVVAKVATTFHSLTSRES